MARKTGTTSPTGTSRPADPRLARRTVLAALAGLAASAAPLGRPARAAIEDDLDQLWICTDIDCSPHVYDPREGDPSQDIPPNTPFGDLPDDWYCPECTALKSAYIPYRRREGT
jgi:rubredoxin